MNEVRDLRIAPIREDHIQEAQRLAQRVWEDVLRKDLGWKIDYPLKPEIVFKAYLGMDPGGCLAAWCGEVMVGAAYAHAWGDVGWIGPMEVDPSWQGRGVGSTLLVEAERYLRHEGCVQVGLEAMAERKVNLSFYEGRGYQQVAPAPFFERKLDGMIENTPHVRRMHQEDLPTMISDLRDLCAAIHPGLDLIREVRVTLSSGLGKVLVHDDGLDGVAGLAIVQTEGVKRLGGHLLRLLAVNPTLPHRRKITSDLLAATEGISNEEGVGRLFFTTTVDGGLMDLMIIRQYRILGTNVRMVKGEVDIEWWDGNIISWTG
jgi:GNAT superfamily N-acetyltransferase